MRLPTHRNLRRGPSGRRAGWILMLVLTVVAMCGCQGQATSAVVPNPTHVELLSNDINHRPWQ